MKEIYSPPVADKNNKKEICGRFILPQVEDVMKKKEYLINAVDEICDYDQKTFNHTLRVANWTATIANKLEMDEKNKELFISAALVHDVGKIEIDKKILNKPDKYNKKEYEEIKKHVELGVVYLEKRNIPDKVIQIMAGHHEHQGDRSYPRKENSEKDPEIKYLSRLLAMVDYFEAATADRPSRESIPLNDVRTEMKKTFKKASDEKIINILTRA